MYSPEQAIADFSIEDSFAVRSVASEPLVEDPVALQFDEDGNMWVVEMRGYMNNTNGGGESSPLGRIKILYDKDGDGIYENSRLFLDSLVMPRAVGLVKGGVLVIEPPRLYFVANINGVAGKKELIDSAFADGGNVEHQPNGLMRAMDNWIYSAKSDKRVRFLGGKWVVEKTQFRGQWGITQDDFGRLFYNDNSTTLMGDQFRPNVFATSEAYNALSRSAYSVQMISNRVFPARNTEGVNRGYQKGALDSTGKLVNVTAACGPVIYRGDNFPERYRGDAFVMEPSAYLLKRVVLTRDSSGFTKGSFPYEGHEFLTAHDERFRPVNAYNAPDGSLFFIDMHRGVIQHPTYLTPYLRQYIDSLKLQRPIGMGRIYSIAWKGHKLSKKLPLSTYTPAQLVALLSHKNGFYRDAAQRLLVDQNDIVVIPQLKTLADGREPVPALHALYTLEGLHALSVTYLEGVAQSATNPQVQRSAIGLLRSFPADSNALNFLRAVCYSTNRLNALHAFNSLAAFQSAFPQKVKAAQLATLRAHPADTLFWDGFLLASAGAEKSRIPWFQNGNGVDTILKKSLVNIVARRRQMQQNPAAALSKKDAELYYAGQNSFKQFCATCHGPSGDGIQNVAPPLAGSNWVQNADKTVAIRILLDGLVGPVTVAGKEYAPPAYSGAMPGLRNNIETNNGVMASVLTYVRNAWGNKAAPVSVADVAAVRQATQNHGQSYTAPELESSGAKLVKK